MIIVATRILPDIVLIDAEQEPLLILEIADFFQM